MHPEALTERGKEIFPRLKLFKQFYLAGGTALALQIGHRISEDFDLFTEDFLPRNLLPYAEKTFPEKEITSSVNNSEELTVFVNGNGTKITFLRYPFSLQKELVQYEEVQIMSIEEIAVTKAYTIGRRGSYKDYVDLYFCLRKDCISLENIIGLAEKKYGRKFNSRLFLEQLVYVEDLRTTEIRFLKDPIGKEEILHFFQRKVGEIEL